MLKPSSKTRDPFTHDAHLYGTDRKQKRGVRLSASAYEDGCWVPIAAANAEADCSAPKPRKANPKPAAKAKPSHGKRAAAASAKRAVPPHASPYSKRARAAVSPLRVGDNTDGLAHRAHRS